jgi:hypothetical protein
MTKPSDIETPPMSLRRENDRQLARFYTIHGFLVGGVLFVMMAIGSQAARDDTGLWATLVQPVPIFIAAAALWIGWRGARLLALSLPFLIALCCIERLLVLFGLSVPRYRDPFAIMGDLQLMNIPGATAFAMIAVVTWSLWHFGEVDEGRQRGPHPWIQRPPPQLPIPRACADSSSSAPPFSERRELR